MTTVLLLGAGASRGTLKESAPTSAEFGQQLDLILHDWRKEYPYLSAAVDFLKPRMPASSQKACKSGWALDKVWSSIDNRVKLQHIWGLSLPGAPFPLQVKGKQVNGWDPWGIAGFELQCVLARIYGENLKDKIQEAARGTGSVRQEVKTLALGDCVISFNYDLLAETILDGLRKEWTRASKYHGLSQEKDRILLCKPHGCLSWKGHFPEERVQGVEILEGPMSGDEIKHDEHPCLVAPVPFKSEIIDSNLQLSNAPSLFYLLVAQWRSAIEYIARADKLVVMGYGFPAEDLHAHYLFAEAAANRDKSGSLKIEVFETCRQRFCEVKAEIERIFGPSGCTIGGIEYKGKVEP